MGVPSTLVQVVGAAGKGRKGVNIAGDEVIKPETSGAKKNAKMWASVIKWGCGIPAIILTAVSALFMVDLASDLARTWGEVVRLSAIALALAISSTTLLAVSGLLENSRPDEAARIIWWWKRALFMLAAAVVYFVADTRSAEIDTSRAQELRAALATLDSPAEWDAWNATSGCSRPGERWRSMCSTIQTRRDAQWAEIQAIESGKAGYSPKALINTGRIAGAMTWVEAATGFPMGEVVRRLLAGVLALVGLVAAGALARIGALGYEEAQRQADGASVPVPVAGASAMSRGGPALTTPQGTADLWFAGRVIEDAEGTMNPTDAYADYAATCEENAQPAMPPQSFYNWLTAKSKNAPVQKAKSNGNVLYRGWVLGQQNAGLIDEESSAALPYHA